MTCRQCGTEIAGNALICFRCGVAVEEAVTRPAQLKKTRRPVAVYVVFAILFLLAVVILWLRTS
jgi:hypothetical protein